MRVKEPVDHGQGHKSATVKELHGKLLLSDRQERAPKKRSAFVCVPWLWVKERHNRDGGRTSNRGLRCSGRPAGPQWLTLSNEMLAAVGVTWDKNNKGPHAFCSEGLVGMAEEVCMRAIPFLTKDNLADSVRQVKVRQD